MKLLVLIAVFAAACSAAPTLLGSQLDHPTPINPSVLIESKAEDKITLISDVNEIAKYKQETSKPLYPTSPPREKLHPITKRDHKPDHKLKTPAQPKTSHPSSQPAAGRHSIPKRNRRDLHTAENPQTFITHVNEAPAIIQEHQVSLGEFQKSTTSDQHKRDIPVPNIPKHKHPEISYKVSSEEVSMVKGDTDKKQKEELIQQELTQQETNEDVQVEDLSESNHPHNTLNVHHTTLPKHGHEFHPQHPDAEVGLTHDSKPEPHISSVELSPETSTEHPVIRPKPVPVAELFARHHDNQEEQ